MVIDPGSVHLDQAGQMTRRWFVRLPRGMVPDDVKDPAIWSKVQDNATKAMHRHDVVYCVGHDEDFAIEARVTDSNRGSVVLGGMKIVSFPERITPLFNDGTYRVVWAGTGYQVERLSDGAPIGPPQGSEALAIREIQRRYPVTAA
jgi:hypothetical protein